MVKTSCSQLSDPTSDRCSLMEYTDGSPDSPSLSSKARSSSSSVNNATDSVVSKLTKDLTKVWINPGRCLLSLDASPSTVETCHFIPLNTPEEVLYSIEYHWGLDCLALKLATPLNSTFLLADINKKDTVLYFPRKN
ncbi:hypothetical protein HGRIS_000892 [Hohenbuehelia grisea]|uniref:Uncharacterized protein n=1 Tax=Hohenbuehelia grisea TaxID=104357 RepID=A0ABR3IQ25_9AGAR